MADVNRKKIYLGTLNNKFKKSTIAGDQLWLTKHTWDCEWYWAFGYIGNKNLHTHFDSVILNNVGEGFNKIFSDTPFTEDQLYVICDLFKQAYALKEAAAVYKYGGHITSNTEFSKLIENPEMVTKLNADLKIVLDRLWDFIEKCIDELEKKAELEEKQE